MLKCVAYHREGFKRKYSRVFKTLQYRRNSIVGFVPFVLCQVNSQRSEFVLSSSVDCINFQIKNRLNTNNYKTNFMKNKKSIPEKLAVHIGYKCTLSTKIKHNSQKV